MSGLQYVGLIAAIGVYTAAIVFICRLLSMTGECDDESDERDPYF
jgi:hypothetical protein